MAGIVLWNVAEGRPEQVDGDKAQALIASGAYREGGASAITQGGATPVIRDASTIGAASAHGEQDTAIAAQRDVGVREQRRRDLVDTGGDKALTFAEGVVDALSFGLIHDSSNTGELRRDVNSSYALAGELTGMVLGMETGAGPTRAVSMLGKKAGRKVAEGILHEIAPGTRAAMAARTAEGAGEMAALMGAGSLGHQVTDSVLADKDFSATAVVHEAGMGALLGGSFSFLHGLFGRAASRYDIQAQGDLLDPTSEASKGLADHVQGAHDAWESAVDSHAQRLGVLKALEADGVLDNVVPEFMAKREIAVAEAQGALSDLKALDFDGAINSDPKEWAAWHGAMERAQAKVQALDELMDPRQLERMRPTAPGAPITDPGAPVTANLGIPMSDVAEMDARMATPSKAAKYEELYGRPYEPQAQYETAQGAENLGGEVSPTSELKTPMAKGTPREPAGPWQPSSPGGHFNPAEWTPARVQGEMGIGRTIAPTEAAQSADNVLSNAHGDLARDQHLFPDGHFAPAAQIQENAQAFSKFQDRMAVDTPMAPAPAKAVEAAPAVPRSPTPAEPVAGTKTPFGPKTRSDDLKVAAREQGKAAVRRYLDEWYATADAVGPVHSPGDYAAQKIRSSVEEMRGSLGGRENAAQATNLGAHLGLPQAQSALGAELNGVYTMRKVAGLAAEASKGTVMTGKSGNRFLNWATRRAAGKVGAAALGAVVGHALGGPVGYFVAAGAAYKYMGFAGRAGGAAGRLYVRTLKAAESLLSGNRAAYAARAVAGNRNHVQPVYSDRGYLKDPVDRIQDLQRIAASPNTMAETVAKASGDLNVISPEFVASTVAHLSAQMTYLASVSPPITYDRLGRPIQPPAGAMRRFLESETAVFDLGSILDAVANGTVTQVQVDALQTAHAAVHAKVAAFLLKDPEQLAALERAKLHTIQMVVGVPLTQSADPMFVARQQAGWAPEQVPGMDAGPTQALKIGSGGPPSKAPASRPLPSQSYGMNGRAPGN